MSQRMLDAAHAEVWVALDVPDLDTMHDALAELDRGDRPFGVKVGLEVVTAYGLPNVMSLCRMWPVLV